MSLTSELHPRTRHGHVRPPATVVALAALLGLLVIGALQGGIAMVTNPVDPLGMSPAYLIGSPVSSYFWPGWFLIGIAAASLLTLPGLIFGWEWHWAKGVESAVGYRWPWLGCIAIGSILLAFELIELVMVPFHPIMHPLLIASSLAILLLPTTPSAKAHLSAR